jgi:hypothetical protein
VNLSARAASKSKVSSSANLVAVVSTVTSGCASRQNEQGAGFEFINSIKGGVVPGEYIKPVQQGIEEAHGNGVIAGYPVVDVKAELYDGSYHEVDSNEMAFKIAGSMALQEGVRKASPVLLEPVMKVVVVTPEEFMGDVIGDLNSKRGRIESMEDLSVGIKEITSFVPLGEMFGYTTNLRSTTQGRLQPAQSMELAKTTMPRAAFLFLEQRRQKRIIAKKLPKIEDESIAPLVDYLVPLEQVNEDPSNDTALANLLKTDEILTSRAVLFPKREYVDGEGYRVFGYEPCTVSDGVSTLVELNRPDAIMPDPKTFWTTQEGLAQMATRDSLRRQSRGALITLGGHIATSGAFRTYDVPSAYHALKESMQNIGVSTEDPQEFVNFGLRRIGRELLSNYVKTSARSKYEFPISRSEARKNIDEAWGVIGRPFGAWTKLIAHVRGGTDW